MVLAIAATELLYSDIFTYLKTLQLTPERENLTEETFRSLF